MPDVDNLVYETSTTTGTGNFTVVAVNGKQRLSDAHGTGGTDVFWYFISSRSAVEWEVGTGHMSDANTLVRDTVYRSTNSDAAVDFAAGTKDVTNAYPAHYRPREGLTATRDFYVATTGNDTTGDGSSGSPWATINHAVQSVLAMDLNGFSPTINVADGTYARFSVSGPGVGFHSDVGGTSFGNLQIIGNTSTPANCVIDGGGSGIGIYAWYTYVGISGFTVQNCAQGLYVDAAAWVDFSSMVFGACSDAHVSAARFGVASAASNYSIVDDANYHWRADGGAIYCSSRTITLTGTPAFGANFAASLAGGRIIAASNTFSGAATGSRYYADTNGTIYTGGGGATYFPGNAVGVLATGGVYDSTSADQPLDADLTSWAGVTRASGFDTFVATPTSANLDSLVTDDTGSGALVFANTPTLVTPILGTPTSGTLSNCDAGSTSAKGVVELATQYETELKSSTSLVPTPAALANYSRGLLHGCTMFNSGVDATNDILVAEGVAAAVDTPFELMHLVSSITGRLDGGTWVVGNNQPKLDTGSEATSTWYHVFVIMRPDTGVVDILFSTSATTPTMPSNYTKKRRIGSFYNDSGSTIRPFYQQGDYFHYQDSLVLLANSSTAIDALTYVGVPTGVNVQPILSYWIGSNTSDNTSLVFSDARPGDQSVYVYASWTAYSSDEACGNMPGGIFTDTSGRIWVEFFDGTAGTGALYLDVNGWIDDRGRTL